MINTVMLNLWIRRHRQRFNLLLALAILFNTASAFAYQTGQTSTDVDMRLTVNHHEMASSCCPDKSTPQNHTCHTQLCNCDLHCTTLLFMHQLADFNNLLTQAPPQLADLLPVPQVYPPPHRPPQG